MCPNFKYLNIQLHLFFILRHYEYKYSIHLNTNTNVGKVLLIVHGGNNFINAKSIGEHVTIYQGATIGANVGGISTILSNVTIYTTSTVVGNIVIGNNTIVGANTFLNKNIPDNHIAVGVPARIKYKKGMN